ncbi:MAG: GNAT family N-acetyltransferase [Candidatus Promineifilaceae bacterium]
MTLVQETITEDSVAFELRPALEKDLQAVVTLINEASMDQIGRPVTNEREVGDDWRIPSFDLAGSTRVAETGDGRLIGYIEVWDHEPLPVTNWVWARVHPDFLNYGVGTALMDWAERRLQDTLTRVPDNLQVVFRSAAPGGHEPTKDLFLQRDMSFVRRFWHMMIEFNETPPPPVWPDGITLSSFAEQDDLRAIVRADNEAFSDHWGYVPQPEDELVDEFQEWIDSDSTFDPKLWFLAMDGEEVAGICLCARERAEYPGSAWVRTLGVRRPWRRRGLGLALLHHAFGAFYDEGKQGVGLGVDSASLTGATRLYEKAGMSIIKEDDAYEKEIRPGRDLSKK